MCNRYSTRVELLIHSLHTLLNAVSNHLFFCLLSAVPNFLFPTSPPNLHTLPTYTPSYIHSTLQSYQVRRVLLLHRPVPQQDSNRSLCTGALYTLYIPLYTIYSIHSMQTLYNAIHSIHTLYNSTHSIHPIHSTYRLCLLTRYGV